jgi:hypothetical protein
MKYKDFLKCMNDIKEFRKESDTLNEHLSAICEGSFAYCEVGGKLLDSYISVLEKLVNDNGEWIQYFVYECNFGENPLEVSKDEKVWNLDSVEKLWEIMNEC